MTAPLPVLRVNGARADVAAALAWLSAWGAPPRDVARLDVDLPDVQRRFGAHGGMASGRFNSQALVREALAHLEPGARRELERAPEQLVLVTPAGFHPHVWQPRDGGVALGRGRWVRRYALVPDRSPLGHIAHELGHLAHGWPDLHTVRGLGDACLMARGAQRADGPAPPCIALRIAAGWVEPARVSASTLVEDVRGAFRFDAGHLHLVGERNDDRLFVARVDERGLPLRATTLPASPGRLLLALVAEVLD